jgi:hypothetical protein
MWRRFNFFERHALEPPRELGSRAWACSAAGAGGASLAPLLFFGADDGGVAAADTRLRPLAGWRAHDARCTHLVFCAQARGGVGACGGARRAAARVCFLRQRNPFCDTCVCVRALTRAAAAC